MWAILMSHIKKVMFHFGGGQGPEVVNPEESSQVLCLTVCICQVGGALRKLKIIFPAKDGSGPCVAWLGGKAGIIQFQLDSDKFDPC